MSGTYREDVLQFAAETFHTTAEYLFRRSPQAAVLRHAGSRKWYAAILPVSRKALGIGGEGMVDVVNVKCEPLMLGSWLMQPGFLPAYHMAKGNWVSILLDGSVEQSQVFAALRMSYTLVSNKSTGRHRTEPKEWLVPANPKYEDLSASFAQKTELFWKQSGRFIVGDTLYIYEGKPIGAVTYACEVLQTDIPMHYDQGGLHMDTVVRIALRARFSPEQFPLERLHDYGITGVRGPRGVPEELSVALRASGTAI